MKMERTGSRFLFTDTAWNLNCMLVVFKYNFFELGGFSFDFIYICHELVERGNNSLAERERDRTIRKYEIGIRIRRFEEFKYSFQSKMMIQDTNAIRITNNDGDNDKR